MKTTRESCAQALINLGYEVSRQWAFKLREDERTASAYVNKNGLIHDFGSGFHGDLVDVLVEFLRFSKRDALKKAKELLNLPTTTDFSQYLKRPESISKKTDFIDEQYLQKFYENRKTHFREYSRFLKSSLPCISSPLKRKEIALKYEIGFCNGWVIDGRKSKERLIMPIRNENGKIVTLWKYNPFLDPQHKLRYTQGRNRYAFNIQDLKKYRESPDEIIYICEGEKDVLNAIGYGLRAVTPGSAASIFEEKHLEFFEGLRIVIVGDNDEAGKLFNENIKKQLSPLVRQIRELDWLKFLKAKEVDFIPPKGFDLTDWLTKKSKE